MKTRVLYLMIAMALSGCGSNNEDKRSNSDVAPEIPTDSPVVTRGIRMLGFDVVNTTPASSFVENINKAKSIGAGYITFHVGWNQIEPVTPNDCSTPGTYVDAGLTAFSEVANANGVKVALSVLPITTNIKMMPSNLASQSLATEIVRCRYKKMLEYTFSKIQKMELELFIVSNEMEAHSDSFSYQFWTDFWVFYSDVVPHIKSLRSGVKIGLSGTMEGLIGSSSNTFAQEGYRALNQISDFIGANYYPKELNLKVLPPDQIGANVDSLISYYNMSSYPEKPIVFHEFGYQTGSVNSSSEKLQADVITELFKIWDKYETRISHVGLLRLNDVSLAQAAQTADDYGLPVGNPMREQFIDYIRTLGFFTFDGDPKLGFDRLRDETRKRAW